MMTGVTPPLLEGLRSPAKKRSGVRRLRTTYASFVCDLTARGDRVRLRRLCKVVAQSSLLSILLAVGTVQLGENSRSSFELRGCSVYMVHYSAQHRLWRSLSSRQFHVNPLTPT